jgi:hypothetical protein
MFLSSDVEVMSLDLLGILLEGNHRAEGRHFTEGIGALVEAVATAHDLAIADGGSLRAMHADIGRRLGEQADEEIDPVNLKLDMRHGLLWHGRVTLILS